MTRDVGHHFTWWLASCVPSSVKCLFLSFVHFPVGLFVFHSWVFRIFLYFWNTSPLWDTQFANPFCQPVALFFFFNLLNRLFHKAKCFQFQWRTIYNFFPFMDCDFGVKSKNSLPSSRSWRFSPLYFQFFRQFYILSLSAWLYWGNSCAKCEAEVHFYASGAAFSSTVYWKDYLSSIGLLFHLCQESVGPFAWVYF